jgi:lysophospholipase L1-like esterase
MTLKPETLIAPLLTASLAACQGAGAPPKAAPALAAQAQAASPSPRPLTLVTLGASDVVGVGAARPQDEGWAPMLAGLLPGETRLVRLGRSGAKARELRADLLAKGVRARPDVAVVFTGVNDLAGGVDRQAFRGDLDAIVGELRGAGARVYVLNLPDVTMLPDFAPYASLVRPTLGLWQETIRQSAAGHGAQVIELAPYAREIARNPRYISADGFHPSALGYRRLAEIVAGAISGPLTRPAGAFKTSLRAPS